MEGSVGSAPCHVISTSGLPGAKVSVWTCSLRRRGAGKGPQRYAPPCLRGAHPISAACASKNAAAAA